ncbi:hypothetical protein [Acinetobacter larvae]|uniref:Lipoprotein n=1 Tax=Acinetobacter larvae TaxID=1789224 RepID=A0A1B2LXF6_9GAMM|nr:hypothetical protein [Acinetobacter larvae]AOA57616.1 hypothetical protein BFG52_04095 [Acinetobacter larvae]
MKTILLSLLSCSVLAACHQPNTPPELNEQTTASENISISTVAASSTSIPTKIAEKKPVDPLSMTNTVPLPTGYQVDNLYLKQPLRVDLNGDGKLDSFQVLHNPNKAGLKYLFEFRINDSDQVYYYESDNPEDDLDLFGSFDIAKAGQVYVDQLKIESDDLVDVKNAPEEAKIYLQHDGVLANWNEETCATSLFYFKDNKIHRAALC